MTVCGNQQYATFVVLNREPSAEDNNNFSINTNNSSDSPVNPLLTLCLCSITPYG